MNKSKPILIGQQQNCNYKCENHTPGKIQKQKHGFQDLKQLIYSFRQLTTPTQEIWSQTFMKIDQYFFNLKKQLQLIQEKIQKQFYQLRIRTTLGVEYPETINNIISLLNQDTANLTCHDIYQLTKIAQKEYKPLSNLYIIKKAKTIFASLNQNLKNYTQLVQFKYEQSKQQFEQKPPITRNMPKEQQTWITKTEKNVNLFKKKYSSQKQNANVLKICDLQTLNKKQNFNIFLKVLKIIKKFDIDNTNKLQFLGGDQTGIASCVINFSNIIKQNSIILINNCRIYLFHQTIKQIQTNKNSTIQISDKKIHHINHQFNLSKGHDRNKKISPRKKSQNFDEQEKINSDSGNQSEILIKYQQNNKTYKRTHQNQDSTQLQLRVKCTKIENINPGDQNLTIIAQIISTKNIYQDKTECQLGDGTGVVDAFLPNNSIIKENITVMISNATANVVNSKIKIQSGRNFKIEQSKVRFSRINLDKNISNKEWQLIDDQSNDW